LPSLSLWLMLSCGRGKAADATKTPNAKRLQTLRCKSM
jgi:hypothetical protein